MHKCLLNVQGPENRIAIKFCSFIFMCLYNSKDNPIARLKTKQHNKHIPEVRKIYLLNIGFKSQFQTKRFIIL